MIACYNDITILESHMRYDVVWSGICRYESKLYKFMTSDWTDYEAMEQECPACKEGGTSNYADCKCDNYTTLMCYLTPLSWWEKIKYEFRRKCRIWDIDW